MASKTEWRRVRVERGIYLQPNGVYTVCVMIDGKARFRVVDASTVEEARHERKLLAHAVRHDGLPASPRLTFAEVARRWLDEFESKVRVGERRERTLEHYRGALERHLLPQLGRRQLQLISTDDLAQLVAVLRTKGLSPWTVNGLLVPLSCVFSFAVRRSYIASNPLRGLHPDERPHPRLSDQRVLTRAELSRLLRATPLRYKPLLATAIFTGMRFSEVLALSWDDIDFAAGVIHVRYQLARGRRGLPPHRVAPKTRASVREIPLVPQLAAVLRDHKRHARFRDGGDYVFATRTGRPLLHRNAARLAFTRAVIDSGLRGTGERRIRFHDLRHTFASHLIIDIRLDVAQVSRILGHARTSITLDTYTHMFQHVSHNADVRTQIAHSEFATALAQTLTPSPAAPIHTAAGIHDHRLSPPARGVRRPAHRCQAAPRTAYCGCPNRGLSTAAT
ncbi:MAG: tyrosine-type recombinase/integrase [Gaiellaceae bacterium]